jgi:hypothetical protein
MMHDDDTDQDIGDDESEGQSDDTREITLSSDIEKDNLDHQHQFRLLGQVYRDKSSRTTRVPFPIKGSRANTVIARPFLPNPWKPPGSMALPLLKG